MKFATNDTSVRAKIGERRCFYSMRIHEALRRNGRTATVIAYELKVSLSAVSATILGKNHSARILDALRDAGPPVASAVSEMKDASFSYGLKIKTSSSAISASGELQPF